MRVWILQTGEPVHTDVSGLRPMRAMNLANALLGRGHEVTLWTSNFDHFSKKHRFGSAHTVDVKENFQIRFIHSRGYKSHFGLGRLLDHMQLGLNLRKSLKFELPPDVSFIGYPPIEPAFILSSWLTGRKKPFMVDVKDAWPQILLRALPKPIRPLGKIALVPYFIAMKKTFVMATSMSSITESYLDWCNKSADRKISIYDRVTPLTVQKQILADSEWIHAEKVLNQLGIFDDGRFRLTFIGTLNSAFDFTPIIEAIQNLDIQLVIAGHGPQFQNIKEQSCGNQKIVMLGWIDTSVAQVLMAKSSFMLAPLRDLNDFKMSMPNKFFDAMQNGKPILTSISGYAGAFVTKHRIGVEYTPNDVSQLEIILKSLIDNPNSVAEMGQRASDVYKSFFDFNYVYGRLVDDLETLAFEAGDESE